MYLNNNTGNTYNSGGNLYMSSGSVILPSISYSQPTLTIGTGTYRTFKASPDFSDEIIQFVLPQQQFTLVDNTKYYVCVKYNNGSPIMFLETDISQTNDSNVLVVYTIFTEGSEIDVLNWGREAIGLPNKLNERFIDTQRFGFVDRFSLSASSLIVTVGGGSLYIGTNRLSFLEINSLAQECELLTSNGTGGWNFSNVDYYPNTQYDDGSGILQTLPDGKYGVIWVWRSVGNQNEIYIALGSQAYDTVDASKSSRIPSNLPEKISLGAPLIGRIIFQKGSTTAITETVFEAVFNASAPTSHDSLLNIKGGVAGEHYHLTQAKYNVVGNTSGTNTGDETQATIKTKLGSASALQDGYLTSIDWNTFNNKESSLTKGNLTAGSTKITIGGVGTGAVIGTGVSVDVNTSNILHNDLSTKQGGMANEYYHLTSQQYSGLTTRLFEATATKTITNTTTETTQIATGVGTLVIPANTLKVGSRVRCRTKGYISTGNNQPATIRFYLGGNIIATSTGANLPNALSNNFVELDFEFVVRSVGETGNIICEGRTLLASSSGIGNPFLRQIVTTTPVSINTTISNTFDLTYQWTNALVANSVSVEILTLEIVG